MFVAIPKEDFESGVWCLCLITQSRGQAIRILTQRGKKPEDYDIVKIPEQFDIKEVKERQ